MNIIFTYYAHINTYGVILEKNRGGLLDRKFE